MTVHQLPINAWYGDQTVGVHFPDDWEVIAHRPRTPRPVNDDDVLQALRQPRGQPPIRELARGRSRPVIIVDDCTRPTPAARVLPYILDELQCAGIPAHDVGIVVATGTHGPPGDSALRQKLGDVAWSHCRVHVHDDQRRLVHLGRDSRGAPVLVNHHVAAAGYVIGVGGVYPQNSTGFGGGAKLALGVLGRRTIVNLHFGNPSEQGSYNIDNDFRRELDEIADMVRLETSVCLHVDANREAVRITTGDHRAFYRDAVAFAKGPYRAAPPRDADVVVANAYPMDLSLTFLRSKAITPLLRAAPSSSRLLIAGCPEGVGRHGLYPFLDHTPAARLRHLYRHLLVHPGQVPRAAASKAARLLRSTSSRTRSRRAGGRTQVTSSDPPRSTAARPIWLYTPNVALSTRSSRSLRVTDSWDEILGQIRLEQAGRPLRVALYPCSPLQVLGEQGSDSGIHA
jgi:nickel-dependent lactate racemase